MEWKWHKYPDEKPEKRGKYIVLNSEGLLSLNFWECVYRRANGEEKACFLSHQHTEKKDVYAWLELPEIPMELISKTEKIKRLENKIKVLEKMLSERDKEG